MPTIRPFVVVVLALLAGLAAPAVRAQSGQQLYAQWCQGCHGNPVNNQNNVLGGKDWNIIKLAMDTKPAMNAELRPAYNSGLITDATFQSIATYLQTFSGGVIAVLQMPSAINFGALNVGVGSSVVSRNLSTTAASNAAVQVSSVTSTNPLEFTVVSNTCNGAFVFPGSPCTVGVQFTPATTGARTGKITVTSNGTGSPQTFDLSGTGQSGTPAGSLSVPSSLAFGSQPVGAQSAAQAIFVSNPSAASVTVSGVQTSSASEFPIVSNNCATVPAGGGCTVTVAFNPPIPGSRVGTVTISSNGTGSPQAVTLTGTGTTAPPANKVQVVEYYNAGFGHYFVTAQADEIAGLDAGAFNFAFVRTGRTFFAWDAQVAGTVPVCRFFTLTFAPKSSHFYTGNSVECDGLKLNPNWAYEKIAFYIAVPVNGVCPAGTVPVYRMYNDGQTGAPNHRFTTDFPTYQDFLATKGWLPEGIGFCAPP